MNVTGAAALPTFWDGVIVAVEFAVAADNAVVRTVPSAVSADLSWEPIWRPPVSRLKNSEVEVAVIAVVRVKVVPLINPVTTVSLEPVFVEVLYVPRGPTTVPEGVIITRQFHPLSTI
jgi:hypothetical protein